MNSLLAFQYKDDAEDYHKYHAKGNKGNRRRLDSYTPIFNKEQYMQASFKFIVRPPKSNDMDDYL